MTDFWPWFDDYASPLLKSGFCDRSRTFRKMFEHLDGFEHPVRIFETGCIEDPDNRGGNGCSTILFDRYARSRPGSVVLSVDIDVHKVDKARKYLASSSTTIACGDSVECLKSWAATEQQADLLYLDASHFEWHDPVPSAHHHLSELFAAMPLLHQRTLVAVDDSPSTIDEFPNIEIHGKGSLVARYANSIGAEMVFGGDTYQAGWVDMARKASRAPENIEDLIARARAAVESNHLTVANQLYRAILRLTMRPWRSAVARIARGEACVFFARTAVEHERLGFAIEWYREALGADPRAVEYRVEMAVKALYPLRAMTSAISELIRATRLDPNDVEAKRALGLMYHEDSKMELAAAQLDKALEIKPDDHTLIIDRALIDCDNGDAERTLKLAKMAEGGERHGDALHVQGMALYRLGRHEEAVAKYDEAIAAEALNCPRVHWHKSMAMEAIGRWPEAFRERNWRTYCRDIAASTPMVRFLAPLFDGTQLAPSTIHVHAESGAGDNIAMVRYLPLLAEQGFRVRYEAQDELHDLIKRSFPSVDVVKRAPDYPGVVGVANFDCHCPIGALQNAFKTTVETVPWPGPYIVPDETKVSEFSKSITRPSVGLCWSSGIRLEQGVWMTEYGLRKSMHFDLLKPLVAELTADHDVVSLQVGPERTQNTADAVRDLLPDDPTWDDTAALVANLDLVITVDTAIAHLAGAMGKPVWVMMQRDGSSWHFMCWRPGAPWNERSLWYPSVRVFRQHEFNRPHFWGEVIADVVDALRRKSFLQAAE